VSVPLTVGGEPGEAVAFDGDESLRLIAPRAYAPGTPIELELALGAESLALRGKARGSKRRDDGRFDVHARLVSLRREARAALTDALR